MQDTTVEIIIDGQKVACKAGDSIIEAADKHGIYIPRFCYHERLSVVANCRMCLVEVEGAAKALPACATPVNKDMVVATQSPKARSAQTAVMQFLLINHPLDCPICDQGGECDLQDIAMGYGAGISKFTDKKRAVVDEDLGPLVATEMTRCIHCTRCVRFGDEIAGIPELALTQRGGKSKISTYLEQGLNSELSGNMIDVCPVGALTSKPFRFHGRSWGYEQHNGLAMHDCLGSNTYLHIDKTGSDGAARVMRVLPRANKSLNDQWLSDVDRFSYQGMTNNRLQQPMIKKNGKWQEVDWFSALDSAAKGMRQAMLKFGDSEVAVIANPQSSLEEAYLMQQVMRAEGIVNIDHRYKMQDFAFDEYEKNYPSLGITLEQIEQAKHILLIGGDFRRQQPMLNHRIRTAALAGAKVALLHAYDPGYNFELGYAAITGPDHWLEILKQMLNLAGDQNFTESPETEAKKLFESVAAKGVILLGLEVLHHHKYSQIRQLAELLAAKMDLTVALVTDGANTAGMYLAGVLPHRSAFADKPAKIGDPKLCSFIKPAKAYWLHQFNCFDSHDAKAALKTLNAAEFVVSCQSYIDDNTLAYADVILPLALPHEIAGIWVNAEGRWQTSAPAVMPHAAAKPGWKIYRALAECLEHDFIKQNDIEAIRQELRDLHAKMPVTEINTTSFKFSSDAYKASSPQVIKYWPANQVDSLVRAANSLQELRPAPVLVHPELLKSMSETTEITISGTTYSCVADAKVALDTIIIPQYEPRGDNK